MGILQALDCRIPGAERPRRGGCVGSLRLGRELGFCSALHAPHRQGSYSKFTRGPVALPQVAAGLPVVTVITTGAKSGLRRATPLLGIPHGDDLAVIGTQFGQPGTPGWYYNLRANPSAEIVYQNRRVQHRITREADGDEWHVIWDRARQIYSGYESYASRIHNRPIHHQWYSPEPVGSPEGKLSRQTEVRRSGPEVSGDTAHNVVGRD